MSTDKDLTQDEILSMKKLITERSLSHRIMKTVRPNKHKE